MGFPQDKKTLFVDLADHEQYRRWREQKLETAPQDLGQMVVEINDPRQLSQSEHAAMLRCIHRANMVIYVSKSGDAPDKSIPHRIGEQFGLHNLNHNWLADDDGITSCATPTRTTSRH